MNSVLKQAERREFAHVCRAMKEVTLLLVAHSGTGAETSLENHCEFTVNMRKTGDRKQSLSVTVSSQFIREAE